MAYPITPKQGYLRTPARFPHDAFAVDTGGRVRPHSGIDSTPTVANAQARSVLGGTVVRADWTKYAGNFVVEAAPDGWLWITLHLANRLVRPTDDTRFTQPDSVIGIVGNTGGGGALGSKATIGIHSHVSRCRDMAAVNRIINGLVRGRYKGETNEEWAAAHGLSDPYPHIIASVSGKANTPADPATPIDTGELTVAQIDELKALIEAKDAGLHKRINDLFTPAGEGKFSFDAANLGEVRSIKGIVTDIARRLYATGGDGEILGFDWLPVIAQRVAAIQLANSEEIAKAVASKINIAGLTEAQVKQIAEAVADENLERMTKGATD